MTHAFANYTPDTVFIETPSGVVVVMAWKWRFYTP